MQADHTIVDKQIEDYDIAWFMRKSANLSNLPVVGDRPQVGVGGYDLLNIEVILNFGFGCGGRAYSCLHRFVP